MTIEQVAAEAEVSPSTVYRYFGTKEGLVILDEFDDPALGGLVSLMSSDTPLVTLVRTAISAIDGEHFVKARELTMVRSRMIMESPALRAAAGMRVVEISLRAGRPALCRHAIRTTRRSRSWPRSWAA